MSEVLIGLFGALIGAILSWFTFRLRVKLRANKLNSTEK